MTCIAAQLTDLRHLRQMLPASLIWLIAAVSPAPQAAKAVSLPAKEVLSYTAEWRLMKAGRIRLEVEVPAGERSSGWQTRLQLESAGLVSAIYKVDNLYTSSLSEDLCAVSSLLNAHEGSRRRETRVTFDRERKIASYLERDLVKDAVVLEKEIDIPGCVHDVVGGLAYLRTLRVEPGQSIQVPMSDGKKSVSAQVNSLRREQLKINNKVYKTVCFEAMLFNGVLYRRQGRLFVWLTDDERRLPVQIQARIKFPIGTITLQLEREEST